MLSQQAMGASCQGPFEILGSRSVALHAARGQPERRGQTAGACPTDGTPIALVGSLEGVGRAREIKDGPQNVMCLRPVGPVLRQSTMSGPANVQRLHLYR